MYETASRIHTVWLVFFSYLHETKRRRKKSLRSLNETWGGVVLWYAENWPKAKSFGPGQPAHSVQADLCETFCKCITSLFSQSTAHLYVDLHALRVFLRFYFLSFHYYCFSNALSRALSPLPLQLYDESSIILIFGHKSRTCIVQIIIIILRRKRNAG